MPDTAKANRIFDGKCLRCTIYGDGPRLFATFDNYILQKSTFGEGGPSRKIIAAGFRNIVIQTASNDWYLNAEMDDLVKILRQDIVHDRPSKALGFSMGGFAALLFADVLQTTDLFLVSPRFPRPLGWEGKSKINCEDRFLTSDWQDRLIKAATNGPKTTTFFDPRHRDDRMAARWLESVNPQARSFALTFGGHPSTGYIKDSQLFGVMQDLLLKPAFAATEIVQLKKKARARSESYRRRVAKYLDIRDSRTARAPEL